MPAKARKPGIFEGAVAADLRKRGNLYSGRDHSGTREYPGDVYCRHGIGSRTGSTYRLRYERLFRVRYWDYTGKFLNINGYICLASVLCWGVMTILVVDVIHVRIEQMVMMLSTQMTDLIVLIATPLFTIDFVTSFIAAMRLRDILISKERIVEELKKLAVKKDEPGSCA